MFVNVVDYHGNTIAIDPKRIIKLRSASLSNEPKDTVFVDYASNGTFVRGRLADIVKTFGPYVRLARLHAPNGDVIFVHRDGIASVAEDSRYDRHCMLIVTVEFVIVMAPARNKTAVNVGVSMARDILERQTFYLKSRVGRDITERFDQVRQMIAVDGCRPILKTPIRRLPRSSLSSRNTMDDDRRPVDFLR